LNLNFIAWMNVWWQRRYVFIVIQIQNHLRFQNRAYKPLGRMKMLPIFMQHMTSIKTQFLLILKTSMVCFNLDLVLTIMLQILVEFHFRLVFWFQ
jgi:hypothetical protein